MTVATDKLADVRKLLKSTAFRSLRASIAALDPAHMAKPHVAAHLQAVTIGMAGLETALALDSPA